MWNKILDNSRQIMYVNVGVFFLVSSGFVFRMYWSENPLHYAAKQLLAKDAKLLVSILSHPRLVNAAKRLSTPDPKAPKAPNLARYIVDRMLAKDGAMLKQVTAHLLHQPSIKKVLQESTKPAPTPSTTGNKPPAWQKLAQGTIDKLLAKDAHLLIQVSQKLIKATQQPTKPTRTSTPNATTKALQTSLDKLGRYVVDRVFANDGKVVTKVIQTLAPPPKKGQKAPPRIPIIDQATLERLGKYMVDRVLHARAKPIRAILQELVGAEAMRLVREGRMILQQFNQQLTRIQIDRVLKGVAYETGKGVLEGFLQSQQKRERQQARKQRLLQQRSPQLQSLLRKRVPCLKPHTTRWLQRKKGAVLVQVRFHKASKQCSPQRCNDYQQSLRNLLLKQEKLVKDPADLSITLHACQTTKETTKAKAPPRTTAPKLRIVVPKQ